MINGAFRIFPSVRCMTKMYFSNPINLIKTCVSQLKNIINDMKRVKDDSLLFPNHSTHFKNVAEISTETNGSIEVIFNASEIHKLEKFKTKSIADIFASGNIQRSFDN